MIRSYRYSTPEVSAILLPRDENPQGLRALIDLTQSRNRIQRLENNGTYSTFLIDRCIKVENMLILPATQEAIDHWEFQKGVALTVAILASSIFIGLAVTTTVALTATNISLATAFCIILPLIRYIEIRKELNSLNKTNKELQRQETLVDRIAKARAHLFNRYWENKRDKHLVDHAFSKHIITQRERDILEPPLARRYDTMLHLVRSQMSRDELLNTLCLETPS